jgi:5-formyltetrahydrofolate cyclo-ligase
VLKSTLRKKIIKIRRLKNNKNINIPFKKIYDLFKNNNDIKIIGGYYPVHHEINDLEILKNFEKKKFQTCLPIVKKNFDMDFYLWKYKDPLFVSKYGIPEPKLVKPIYPDVILIPLVAFDKKLNRLGYGAGYYDRYIEKITTKKNILKIGLALSCQKINNVPVTKYDKKLDYIVTEKYIL